MAKLSLNQVIQFPLEQVSFILSSLKSTNSLAEKIAEKTNKGDVICLYGELGVGKTAFAKAFINHFFEKPQKVTSPTFNILQIYKSKKVKLSHYDLYRVKAQNEVIELGIDESFNEGITLIEWPEVIQDLLPKNRIEVKLSYSPNDKDNRIVSITGYGFWSTIIKDMFD